MPIPQNPAWTSADNLRGSAFMLLAMASFAIGDGMVKYTSSALPLSQIIVIRGVFAVLILLAVCRWLGSLRHIGLLKHPLLVFRVLAEVVATFTFFTALFNMPIADVSAIMQAVPLTVTAGAALFLSERVGWKRIGAIMIGLTGVLLIIKPGFSGFSAYSLLTLVTVIAASARDLATRRLPPELDSTLISLATVAGVSLIALTMAPFQQWQAVTAPTVGLLACASIFLVSGFYCIVSAMRVGEVGVVTPFRYFFLLFAGLVGFMVFDEVPDRLTVLGSAIVVCTGLYTIYRERVNARHAERTTDKGNLPHAG